MDLQEYIERSRIVDLATIGERQRPDLLRLLEEGIHLPDLVQEHLHLIENLPRAQLHRLFEARAEWSERLAAVERLTESLQRSGLPVPPQAARKRALVPHKIDALERVVRICPRSTFEDEEAWVDALVALLDVWSGAVAQTLRRGNLKVNLDGKHPDAEQFEEYARRTEVLSDLPSHRWQAIRRGERAGALAVSFEPPISSIRGHLESIRSRLGSVAEERELDSVIDELVLSVLPGTLRAILDRRAEDEAIRSAVSQYQKLLTSPPHAAGQVGALAIRGNGSGVGVLVSTEGDIPEVQEVVMTDEEGWEDRVESIFSTAGIEMVVLPMSSPAEGVLAALRKRLEEDYSLVQVRVAALAEARRLLTEPPLSLAPEIASGLVLVRRAMQPADEWERVDPVAIGLADYQQDLDEDRLREALLEALGLFQLDRASGNFVPPPPRVSARSGGGSRLNPMIKTIGDLRPGMVVNGVITNITRFGAFVNVGLAEEGMIHISELSTQYVQSPSDVVSIGERVSARVLDVEPSKKRIALSLKQTAGEGAEPGGRNVPLDTRVKQGGRKFEKRTVGRAQALQQLEDLFKK